MSAEPHRKGFRPRRAGGRAVLAVVAAVAIGLALVGSQSAGAQSVSALQSKAEGARQQADALASRIASQNAQLEASRADAVAAAKREAELNATLASGEAREQQLTVAVEQAQSRLREARSHLRRSSRLLSDRLVAIYKQGGPEAIEVLLSSEGYDDLSTRFEYLERIQAADSALVDRTRDLRAEVSGELDAVAAARSKQAAHNEQLAAARDQIAAVRARAEAQSASLIQARSSQQAEIEQLRGQVQRWQQQVQRQQRVSAAEAEQQVADQIEGDDWAIPTDIVMCESGGNYNAVNPSSGAGGAYQILPSTWKLYGGEGLPQDASPAEQARIAALIWADSGASAWVCAG